MRNFVLLLMVPLIVLSGCGKPKDGLNGANGVNGISGSNGADGYSTLLSITSVAVGDANCSNGGFLELAGQDTNRDNVLEGSEVTSSAYVCNGTNGTNGQNGQAGTNGTNGSNGGTVSFNLVQAIMPCGAASSPWKEVILGLQGGQLLASFSDNASGLNTRFAFIPNGTYTDTDSSGCQFTVTGDGSTVSDISWNSGSTGYHWTQATGWVGY